MKSGNAGITLADLPGAREYCEVRGPRSTLIKILCIPAARGRAQPWSAFYENAVGTFLLGPGDVRRRKDNYEKKPVADCGLRAQRKTLLPEIEEKDLQLGYSGCGLNSCRRNTKGSLFRNHARSQGAAGDSPGGDGSPGLTAAPRSRSTSLSSLRGAGLTKGFVW